MNTSFKPSKYQSAIRDWLIGGTGSAQVLAVPGSGKTTTLTWLISFLSQAKRVLLTSFGKKTTTTLEEKVCAFLGGSLPRAWQVATLHRIGRAAVVKHLESRGVSKRSIVQHGATNFRGFKVPDKTMCILWEKFPKAANGKRPQEYFLYGNFVKRLVGLAKNEGVGRLVPDTSEIWGNLIARHGLWLASNQATESRAIEIAREVLGISNQWSEQGKIDFDDHIFLVSFWDLQLEKQDFILLDEGQDVNRIQLDMIWRMSTSDTRCLFVGDNRQSIYGFRGADANAMEKARAMFNCALLPLSICYRCSKAVVAKANEIAARWECIKTNVPYVASDWQGDKAAIEASPDAQDGKVQTLDEYTPDTFNASDAILCRNTAPLVKLAYQLIKAGKACHVLGREIGQGLIELVKRLDATSIDDLDSKLREYQQRETGKQLDRDNQAEADAISDRCDCVRLFVEGLKESQRTVENLISSITSMFTDTNGSSLTLATIHKAKGLEWDKVYILEEQLMPSKYATQVWQLEQEYNLMFVANTRAKLETYYIMNEGLTSATSDKTADDNIEETD